MLSTCRLQAFNPSSTSSCIEKEIKSVGAWWSGQSSPSKHRCLIFSAFKFQVLVLIKKKKLVSSSIVSFVEHLLLERFLGLVTVTRVIFLAVG